MLDDFYAPTLCTEIFCYNANNKLIFLLKPVGTLPMRLSRLPCRRSLCARASWRIVRGLHDEPDVPMHFNPRDHRLLAEGQVITIEPHISAGKGRIYQAQDGWTLRTRDRSPVAQFEHTVMVTKGKPLVLTALS
jgi:hypothetical protein